MAKIKRVLLCCFIGILLSSCNLFIEDTKLRQLYRENHAVLDEIYKKFDPRFKETVIYNKVEARPAKLLDIVVYFKNISGILINDQFFPHLFEFDSEEEAFSAAQSISEEVHINCLQNEKIAYYDSFESNVILGNYKHNEEFVLTADGNSLLCINSNKSKVYLPDIYEVKTSGMINNYIQEIVCNDSVKIINSFAFTYYQNLYYFVVPESVEYIGYCALACPIIYCEAESKPEGWDENFAAEGAKIYYKGEWEYNEFGKPFPKSNNY